MSNLFIIGNGFDLAHNLPTKYSDFKSFLINNYEANLYHLHYAEGYTDQKGDILYKDRDVAGVIYNLLEDISNDAEWSEFEKCLGLLSYDSLSFEITDVFDREGDLSHSHTNDNYESIYTDLVGSIKEVPKLFTKWISSVDIIDVTPIVSFYSLIDQESDIFLTFNYTTTLEDVYEVDNVVHIHGNILTSDNYNDIIFGHGEDRNYPEESRYHIINESESSIHEAFRKNTQKIIDYHSYFFSNLKNDNITAIYSHGFSFGSVDMPYIKKICSSLDTSNLIWYLDDFSKENHSLHKTIIKSCGFKGDFDTYKLI